MPLDPGTRLGHYDVTALLGEGGMGQVWQATDTQLNRQVALKILPDAFAADPERLARFTREAQILASLNHPNIAAIHGIEEDEVEGRRALVLELVEGPTLADRISKGPIPVDEALPIAKQIAEALEAAHEAGVIHRDLKPANIKVREDGTVKVLDFGLAKALEPNPDADPSQSPTLTAAATQMGVIMGTAAYMSPEQARGKTVDKRADIWAFGAVLFEMLTGQRPFKGRDVSETLAAVMMKEPEWPALPTTLPAPLSRLLRRCLEKEPKDRLRDIGDARVDLGDVHEAPPTTDVPIPVASVSQPAGWRQVLPWVARMVAVGLITGLAVWTFTRPPEALTTRFIIEPPPGVTVRGILSLSPDGRTLAFGGVTAGLPQVHLRPLDQLEAVPLRGAEGTAPFDFSPDGQALLVADAGGDGGIPPGSSLKRVPVAGGPTTTVAAGQTPGATWRPDGTIVLGGTSGNGLRLVRAPGGEATPLTTLAEGEVGHASPTSLPNGRAVLFHTFAGNLDTAQVAVYDFETEQRTNLLLGTKPAFSPTGHLIFWRDGSLWAVPFDPDRLEVEGDPVAVVEGVSGDRDGAYALADNGTLVYLPTGGGAAPTSTLGWVDRNGQMTTPVVEGVGLAMPRLSPDGSRVVFRRLSESGDEDLWVRDLERGSETKLTETGGPNQYPVWTPDGRTVSFGRGLLDRELFSRPADLSREADMIRPTEGASNPGSWTPDGETLVYYATKPDGSERDIWMLPSDGEPVPFLATAFNERAPRLSPNGKWLAYISNQAGGDQVFVQAFPDGGPVTPISTGPGTEVVWSRDGRELFYRDGNQLWVVDVETAPGFTARRPTVLFEAPYDLELPANRILVGYANYDVSPDGQQFLMLRTAEAAETPGIVVVLNWFEELTARVPVD